MDWMREREGRMRETTFALYALIYIKCKYFFPQIYTVIFICLAR